MIGAELRGAAKPNLNEALGWIGSRVDDIYGAGVGRLEDVWIDPGTGIPRWLLVKEGRFGGRTTLIPFEDATAGAGHVWVPYERDVVREAPEIEPGAPLTQQVEAALRAHYAANAAAAVAHGSRSVPTAASPQTGHYQQPHPHAPVAGQGGPAHAHHASQGHGAAAQPQAGTPRGAHPHQHPPGSVEAGSPSALGVPIPPAPPAAPAWSAPERGGGQPQSPRPQPRTQPPPLRPPAPPPRPPAPGRRPPQPAPTQAGRPPFAEQPAIRAVPDQPTPPAPGPAPAPEAAPGRPVGAAPSPPDGTLALPRVDALDQPYWVEIEFEGGAKISGPVKGLRITPMEPGGGRPSGG